MKAVFLLLVLTVFVLLPEEGDAFLARWRRIKDRVKSGWRRLKDKTRSAWQKAKWKLIEKLAKGRRDVDDIDLNEDGAIDQSELETVIGERHARDMWELLDGGNSLTFDEFRRHARNLEELEEEDE